MKAIYTEKLKPFEEIPFELDSKSNDFVYSIPKDRPLELRDEARIVARRAYKLAKRRVEDVLVDLNSEAWDTLPTPTHIVYIPFDTNSKGDYLQSEIKTGMKVFGELVQDFAYEFAKYVYEETTGKKLKNSVAEFIAKVVRQPKETDPKDFNYWMQKKHTFPKELLASFEAASEINETLLGTASYAISNYLSLE